MRNMAAVSARLRARIHRDFPESSSAQEVVRLLAEASESERIQAAIVLWANGDIDRLLDSVDLTAVDWRDVLVRGGLKNEDWPNRLEAEFGPTRTRRSPGFPRSQNPSIWT
jgi:hypothetical protein